MSSLKDLIAKTQASHRRDPASAVARFQSTSELREGLRTEVRIREHRLVVDEPASLGGSDAGPNPVELLLAALGTCQEITYRAFAAALDIPLTSVSVELEGRLDLRGFFATADDVPPGYRDIRGTVRLVSSAPPEALERLRAAVNAHCPVLDTLTSPVRVDLGLEVRTTA